MVELVDEPDEISTGPRMQATAWKCSACVEVLRSDHPIPVPAPPALRRHRLRETAMTKRCPICEGVEWVCENHPDRPWTDMSTRGCECGAGAPCPRCNPLHHDLPFDQRATSDEAVRRIVSRRH